jgi:hypothetical protein
MKLPEPGGRRFARVSARAASTRQEVLSVATGRTSAARRCAPSWPRCSGLPAIVRPRPAVVTCWGDRYGSVANQPRSTAFGPGRRDISHRDSACPQRAPPGGRRTRGFPGRIVTRFSPPSAPSRGGGGSTRQAAPSRAPKPGSGLGPDTETACTWSGMSPRMSESVTPGVDRRLLM